MKRYCVQCGQAIESEDDSAQLTCPACGHVTRLSTAQTPAVDGVKKPRFGITGKDIVIGLISVACLVLLILLFLRPNEPTHRIIFGSLGPAASGPTTGAGGNPPAGSIRPPDATGNNSSLPFGGPSGVGGGLQPQNPPGSTIPPGSSSPSQPADSVGVASADSTNNQSPGAPLSTIAVGGRGVHAAGGIVTRPPGSAGGPITPLNFPSPTAGAGVPTTTGIGSAPSGTSNGVSGISPGTTAALPTSTTDNPSSGPSAGGTPGIQPGSATASTPETPTSLPGTSPTIDPNTGLPAGTAAASQTGLQPGSTEQSGAGPGANPTSSTPPTTSTAATTSQPTSTQTGAASARTFAPAPPSTSAPTDATQPDNPPDQGNVPEQVSKKKTAELLQLASNDAKASGNTNATADSTHITPANSPATTHDANPSNPFDAQHGTNVVFVLDRSLSMRNNDKSVVARNKMVDTLRDLGTNKTFYIIFFPYKPMPADAPLPATDANINAMTNWIFSMGHAFGSNPQKAMAKALEFKPDTVWLLSDGEFSASVPEEIRNANGPVKATINTVGFYSRDGEAVLRRIADENYGQYRFVPPPGENQGINPAPVGDSGASTGPVPRSP